MAQNFLNLASASPDDMTHIMNKLTKSIYFLFHLCAAARVPRLTNRTLFYSTFGSKASLQLSGLLPGSLLPFWAEKGETPALHMQPILKKCNRCIVILCSLPFTGNSLSQRKAGLIFRLNSDQSQGRHLRIPVGDHGIQKFTLFRHK